MLDFVREVLRRPVVSGYGTVGDRGHAGGMLGTQQNCIHQSAWVTAVSKSAMAGDQAICLCLFDADTERNKIYQCEPSSYFCTPSIPSRYHTLPLCTRTIDGRLGMPSDA